MGSDPSSSLPPKPSNVRRSIINGGQTVPSSALPGSAPELSLPPLPPESFGASRERGASAVANSAKAAGRTAKKAPASAKKKRGLGKKIGLGLVFTFLLALISALATFLYMYTSLTVPAASDLALAQKSTLYYSDGSTEMGSLGDINREIIDPSTLPDYVGKAVVASEDRTFYKNSGVDFKGIFRALFTNVVTGSRQGGSTLTQQYVERYYVGETTSSYRGKAEEEVLAIKINREQSKDEILGNYLNTIYFGRGSYGIEAASQAYFGHPASELSLSEAAMLSGIIPAPSAWDPAEDPDKAKDRWARVLNLMVEDGWISQSEADAATFPETINPLQTDSETFAGPNGYLIEQARSELIASGAINEDQIANGGLKIITTIDRAKQDAAVAAAESMKQVEGWNPATMHVALSSVDPNTGEIVAEYAGSDYLERQQNAATQDIAMAGSTFKPFALLANARAGGSVNDTYSGRSPQRFEGLSELVENDGGYSFGNVDLIKATSYSINTSYVALNKDIGPAATMQAAIDAGIPEETLGLDRTLLNVLGYASPHNIDLATAYSTIANGGERVNAHIIRSVTGPRGNVIYTAPTDKTRVFSAEDVSSIMPALEAVTKGDGTASSVSQDLRGFTTAGKTGTAQEQRAAQFVAFVPGLVSAVSMYGSDEDGNSAPLPNIGGLDQFHGGDWPVDVWTQYMQTAVEGMPTGGFDWYVKTNRNSKSHNDSQDGAQSAGSAGESSGQGSSEQGSDSGRPQEGQQPSQGSNQGTQNPGQNVPNNPGGNPEPGHEEHGGHDGHDDGADNPGHNEGGGNGGGGAAVEP